MRSTAREDVIRTIAQMLPWLRPYRPALLLGLVALLFTNVFASLGPWVLKLGIDSLDGADPGARPLWHWALLLLAVAVGDGVFRFLMRKTVIGVSRQVEYDLRRKLYAHLQRLPLPFFERYDVGDLMARVTNDLNSVRMFLGPGIMYTLNTAFVLTFSLALMFRISPALCLVALIPLPLITVMVVLVMSRVHTRVLRVQEGFALLTTRVRENLEGSRVVKAFGREDSQNRLFALACEDYLERNMDLARMQQFFYPAITLFAGVAVALVLWRGGALVMQDAITLGDFVAFTGYLGLLLWPMAALGWTISLFQRGSASWQRIRALLDEPTEAYGEGGAAPAGPGRLELRDVRLTRGAHDVLRGVDLVCESGRVTALVGPTGSGKSSLLRLLARFGDPDGGEIRLDGVPLPEWNLEELRAAIACVPQESFLFSSTIGDNVRMGRPTAADAEVREFATAAALTDEIESFREGFDAVVGERGVTLSGGQRQRATLARALIRDARLLVLDDAFAAMDTRTEERILGTLRRQADPRTIVLVSHRLSTIRQADRIAFLDDGRILETGTHEELTARNGAYARFVRRQQLLEQLQDPDRESAA